MILASIVAKSFASIRTTESTGLYMTGSGKTKWKNSPVGCQMEYTVGFDVGVVDGFPFGGLAK